MIELKHSDCLTDDEKLIRTKVFIEEQGFENEFDDLDNTATHIILYYNNAPVGCVRFFKGDTEGEYYLGRLAVLKDYRTKHLGAILVNEVEKAVRALGANKLSISAQVRVSDFYKKLEFVPMGDTYYDEYCEHIHMEKVLT
jgi:predicted GNAT family N-acyltransferase